MTTTVDTLTLTQKREEKNINKQTQVIGSLQLSKVNMIKDTVTLGAPSYEAL